MRDKIAYHLRLIALVMKVNSKKKTRRFFFENMYQPLIKVCTKNRIFLSLKANTSNGYKTPSNLVCNAFLTTVIIEKGVSIASEL